jgi:hypothetical protein
METLVVTVWFYALVVAGTALAVVLMVRAVRADDRYLARFEPSAEPRAIRGAQSERLAA